ncbi:DUF1211 domain-containing protein [Lactobacillus sp. CBA3605]|uniref:TMEM175 family protein n=1 Tax=Lactobacillus sp. CBA3605 TaxID=2099788 RepID=UPI000CFE0FAE|nr:TMEM175 family protein [Lactobacillus sp. CBA3605]AVK60518.1 DUF1211 domain-containing protein [Lactobacillus sp. CBA3605]
MTKNRLEAFFDAVIAIVITILVLELKLPAQHSWHGIAQMGPAFLAYLISFILLANIWVNHHRLFQAVKKIDNRVLWASMNMLLWISLVPATTAWFGTNLFSVPAAFLYSIVIALFNISFIILTATLVRANAENTILIRAAADNRKINRWSLVNNVINLVILWFWPPFALISTIINSLMWVKLHGKA